MAWDTYHHQLEKAGEVYSQNAKDLQTEVVDKIANFVLDKTNARKKVKKNLFKKTWDQKIYLPKFLF